MITRRILTMKSKVGYGRYGDEQIGRLIETDHAAWVRYVYYNYDTIDFTQEVKDAAMIFIDIEKPGTDSDAGRENEHRVWGAQREQLSEQKYMALCAHKKKNRRIAQSAKAHMERLDGIWKRGRLQAVNQGHGHIIDKK